MKFYASGLLFDNDGVLVDSHSAAADAWAIWCSEFAPHTNWDAPKPARQPAAAHVRARITPPDLFEAAHDRINELEQLTAHTTVALAGAVELTSALTAGTWTVCTSANPMLAKARLEAAGIRVPAELVTADDVKRGKPHPDPYLLGAERLGFAAEDCVVFEDAIAGAVAAEAAGVGLIVGVTEAALAGPADIVIRDLSGITFDGEVLYLPDSNRLR